MKPYMNKIKTYNQLFITADQIKGNKKGVNKQEFSL